MKRIKDRLDDVLCNNKIYNQNDETILTNLPETSVYSVMNLETEGLFKYTVNHFILPYKVFAEIT